MYISPQSAVYRVPVWHPDAPRVYVIPQGPIPAPTRTFALSQFQPDWRLVTPWTELKSPSFTADASVPPTSTPRTFRAEYHLPPPWQLLDPWTSRLINNYTPDASVPPLVPPRWVRAEFYPTDALWPRRVFVVLPETYVPPVPPLPPPTPPSRTFTLFQFVPDWRLVSPWTDLKYPPFTADASRPPTVTPRTARDDLRIPDWKLLQPWTAKLINDYTRDASVPPTITPSRFRSELYPTDSLWPRISSLILPHTDVVEAPLQVGPLPTFAHWQLVSDYWMQIPVEPDRLTEPAPDTTFPIVPQPQFRADLYLREWWGPFTIPIFTPEAVPTPAPYLAVPERFQLSQFPEAWWLSRPWMPRAALTIDGSVPPPIRPRLVRADLFVPAWTAQSPWTQRYYPPHPSLIPSPAISTIVLLRKWRHPSVPVQVNWGHPLAQGLSVAVLTTVPTAFLEDRGQKIRRFTQVGTMGTTATIGGLARDYGGSFQWDSLSDSTILPAGVAASFAYGFVPDTDVPPHRALWSIGNDAVDVSPALDIHVGQVANRMSYYAGSYGIFAHGTIPVVAGRFYHGLYTWTQTGALRQKIYLNGALDSAVDHASVGGNRPTLWLGTGWNQQFDGKLAYFYAWTGRALTQADAYTLMANPTAFWMTNSEWIFGGTPGVPTAGNLVPWHLFGMRAH